MVGYPLPSAVKSRSLYWFVIVAILPSNFLMLMLNGSLYPPARSCRTLSATCSPNIMACMLELRK